MNDLLKQFFKIQTIYACGQKLHRLLVLYRFQNFINAHISVFDPVRGTEIVQNFINLIPLYKFRDVIDIMKNTNYRCNIVLD
jgi:hypothetical protein